MLKVLTKLEEGIFNKHVAFLENHKVLSAKVPEALATVAEAEAAGQ